MKSLIEILRALAAAFARTFRRRRSLPVPETGEAPAESRGRLEEDEGGSKRPYMGGGRKKAERGQEGGDERNAPDADIPSASDGEAGPRGQAPDSGDCDDTPVGEVQGEASDRVADEGRSSMIPLPSVADVNDRDASSVEAASARPSDAASGLDIESEAVTDVDEEPRVAVDNVAPGKLTTGSAAAEHALRPEVSEQIVREDGPSEESSSGQAPGGHGTNRQREDAAPRVAAPTIDSELESPSPGNNEVDMPAPAEESGATEPVLPDGPAVDAAATISKRTRVPAKRVPRQYRPVARAPSVARPSRVAGAGLERRERALRIDLRAQLEHGGFWRISLLPRRDAGLPEEVAINQDGVGSLIALQDEWYQDIVPSDVGALLARGIEWEATLEDCGVVRWSLSGRELFVLSKHDQLSGFVTTPRLVVGERHVVLCREYRAAEVRCAIAATGAAVPREFGTALGAPAGWIGFLEVVPSIPVPPSAGGDILDALCPQPEVEIALEGGIRLYRSTWLAGFPPLIRLRGDTSAAGEVLIDGEVARVSGEGSYVAAHWDGLGNHQVWCAGKSAAYAIAEGSEAWEPWEAYRWSLGELATSVVPARPAICGSLVLLPVGKPDKREKKARRRRAIVVAVSNPLLLGAAAGQIYASPVRSDVRARTSTAFPPFEPVWAVPADALHCNKRSARILLIGPAKRPSAVSDGTKQEVAAWYSAILGASRKGLLADPASLEVKALWKEYKDVARALWRRRR